MSTVDELAKQFLLEDYLLREPEFLDIVEFLDELETYPEDGTDIEVRDAVLGYLDMIAMRFEDADN